MAGRYNHLSYKPPYLNWACDPCTLQVHDKVHKALYDPELPPPAGQVQALVHNLIHPF
jgi:hypothetical protein